MRTESISVTNIERFTSHHGQGVRTAVYFKGCTQHCPWCSSPRGQYMPIDDIMAEVLQDRDIFDNSQGGITISGGEPYVQYQGLLYLLEKSKAMHLDTTVETGGNYSQYKLIQTEPLIDHFIFDLKHINREILRNVTGGDGNKILNNLQYLARVRSEKVHVRIPVIAGFNYFHGLLMDMLKYLQFIGVTQASLIPCNGLQGTKHLQPVQGQAVQGRRITEEELQEYQEYALSLGMNMKIGA